MAAYSIFIPGAVGANNAHFSRVGLDGLVDADSTEWSEAIGAIPFDSGAAGSLATWRPFGDPARDAALTFTEGQVWTPAKADEDRGLEAKRFWIGVDPDRPPRPEDLARKDQLPGEWTVLHDNQPWKIPVASRLPHVHGLNGAGKFARQVSEEYREFYDRAEQYMVEIFRELDLEDALRGVMPAEELEEKINDNLVPIPLEDGWEFSNIALALNYKLTPEIVDVLQLLDDTAMTAIIGAAINMVPILETRDQKKTDSPVGIPLGLDFWNGS